MSINSYPSVFAIDHKAVEGILNGEVTVEEKVDGSQWSFGIVGPEHELQCRTRGMQINIGAQEPIFDNAVATSQELAPILHPGWIYRAEYLSEPKHNTLCYARTPKKYLIGYDIQIGMEDYLPYDAKEEEFTRIGLETVPLLFQGIVSDEKLLERLLDTDSILGGQKVEGVVVKNYALFTKSKKVAMGKFVSEKFKEIHGGEWRKNNPTGKDIEAMLVERYRTPARWQKAVQHLKERGVLEGSPRDIGALIVETKEDVKLECEDEIKTMLFNHFWPHIQRGITSGLPEWYKEQLLEGAFQ